MILLLFTLERSGRMEIFMKKRIICILVGAVIMCMCFVNAYALDYDFKIGDMKIKSDSISVDVEKLSNSSDTAVLCVAMYDEYNTLLDVEGKILSMENGKKETVSVELSANSAVTVKAFVLGDKIMPKSNLKSRTTSIEGEIEYGGDA